MNIEDIKNLSIPYFLENRGFMKLKGTLYQNPLRDDKTASFSVFVNNSNKRWNWKDQSSGEGGNLIDLICKMQNCTVSQVLESFNLNNFSFSKAEHISKKNENDTVDNITINEIKEVTKPGLIFYAQKRGIDASLVKKYLKEIHYTNKDKQYYSLALKNDLSGYELRNKYSKTNIGGKAITTIKNKNPLKVSIFEGFFNFLSALTFFKIDEFAGDVIILNSTVLVEKALPELNKYDEIYTFLDNDESGDAATQKIYNACKNKVKKCNKYYQNFNDFNDFIIK